MDKKSNGVFKSGSANLLPPSPTEMEATESEPRASPLFSSNFLLQFVNSKAVRSTSASLSFVNNSANWFRKASRELVIGMNQSLAGDEQQGQDTRCP